MYKCITYPSGVCELCEPIKSWSRSSVINPLTLSCMNFFYNNHKADNHVKQCIKYTNFKKELQHFLKTIKQPPLHENYPHRLKNPFSIMCL